MSVPSKNVLPPTQDQRCGTRAGHKAHRDRKEIPCQRCRDAVNAYNAEYRKNHPTAYKEYYATNREKVIARVKKTQHDHPETRKKYRERNALFIKEYRIKNIDRAREVRKAWEKANPDKVKVNRNKYRLSHLEKMATNQKRWRANNIEKSREFHRNWHRNNPEKRAIYNEANKERMREKAKKYRSENREKFRQGDHIRRARKLSVSSERYTTQDILNTYGLDCHLCGKPIDLKAPRGTRYEGWENGLHLDHDIPISLGGADTISNVKPAHGKCNLAKRRK